jgi:hypothetical protein
MKEISSIIAVIAGGIAFLLTVVLVGVSVSNRGLERKLQVQQAAIQNGQVSQQVGTAIVRDVAQVSVQAGNTALRDLLSKHGITISTEGANK